VTNSDTIDVSLDSDGTEYEIRVLGERPDEPRRRGGLARVGPPTQRRPSVHGSGDSNFQTQNLDTTNFSLWSPYS